MSAPRSVLPLSDFRKEVARAPGPLYLLVGEDDARAAEAVAALVATLPAGAAALNVETFDGRTADVEEVLLSCRTLPARAPRRLVVLAHAEALPDIAREHLARYAAAPVATTTFVCRAANARAAGALARAMPTVQVTAPKDRLPAEEVRRAASAVGVRIASDAVEALLASQGADLLKVRRELEKLAAYVGEGGTVTAEAVDDLATPFREEKVFLVRDAIAERDAARALAIVHDVFRHGRERRRASGRAPDTGDEETTTEEAAEPEAAAPVPKGGRALPREDVRIHDERALVLPLLGMLANHTRRLLLAREALDAGEKEAAVVARLDITNEWWAERFLTQARGTSVAELAVDLKRIARASVALRTEHFPGRYRWVLERLILDLATARGVSPLTRGEPLAPDA